MVSSGSIGSLAGLSIAVAAFASVESALYAELLLDLKQQAQSGVTLLFAPSVVGVFDRGGGAGPAQSWLVPSEIPFGWDPPTKAGGALVNQFRFKDLY